LRHGRSESGFALLLVFLLAAVMAISLYLEIPRVAFETQRQKEQLLVERGEQYKRAIKLFVSPKGIGHWPAKIEDLENTNNRRFLRHRFVDPFTGKPTGAWSTFRTVC
jgi:type II secretory pathway pseudopilin PulG